MTRKKQVFRTRRAGFLVLIFMVWLALILVKQYDLQVTKRPFLLNRKAEQQRGHIKLIPQRGKIFDRNGAVLAMSLDVNSIYAVPFEIENPQTAARTLSRKLGLGYRYLLKKISSSKGFVWIKRKVEPVDVRRVKKAGLKGIYTYKENKRYYPHDELLSGMLGFAGIDNDGLAGIEYQYDSILKGKPGAILSLKDARRNRLTTGQLIKSVPTSGSNIYLTIDSTIQYYLEQELFRASTKLKVNQSFGIVMNPYTGEILAMASYPAFDLNKYNRFSSNAHRNRALQVAFEPGSTFKIVTAAAALEEKMVKRSDRFYCENGSIAVQARTIRDHKPFGMLTFDDVLVYSSNIGILKIGRHLGKTRFARKIKEYGFGVKTNVDLPGENQGIFRDTKKWSSDSLESISFGQEISVNALQMLRFVSAIANGGYLVEPKVLLERSVGTDNAKRSGKRVLSDRVSKAMTEVMKQVVVKGTGTRASVAGYSAAGKTGTAQKAGREGKYIEGKYIASFVGFIPADNPVISMILVFDEPVGLEDGGDVAAPAFSKISKNILRYLHTGEEDNYRYFNMPGDKNDQRDLRFLLADFRPASLPVLRSTFGGGNQRTVYADGRTSTSSFKMPDLHGHSYRDVFEILSSMGIKPMLSGSGIAVSQHPDPGVLISRDSFCLVRFSRSKRGKI